MKKHISIFVAFTFLLFSTELQELIKLPLLFQHYFEHKAIDEDVTFTAYLIDHYNSVPHTDDDEERDNQLPFKSAEQNSVVTNPTVPPSHKYIIKNIATITLKRPSIYHDEDVPHAFTGSVWQPPKSLI